MEDDSIWKWRMTPFENGGSLLAFFSPCRRNGGLPISCIDPQKEEMIKTFLPWLKGHVLLVSLGFFLQLQSSTDGEYLSIAFFRLKKCKECPVSGLSRIFYKKTRGAPRFQRHFGKAAATAAAAIFRRKIVTRGKKATPLILQWCFPFL